MTAAGLLARNAVAKGLRCKPWVKTSLAPGSRVVTDYYHKSGLDEPLEKLGFHVVGYGCTTCIGNSGPLPEPVSRAIREKDLVTASVLSGNRNFEGRINPDVRANYLMSPPLVVAFALAGRIDINLEKEPLGEDSRGNPVYLRDIWPSDEEIARVVAASIDTEMYRENAREIYQGDEAWNSLSIPSGDRFAWQPDSTYIRQPTFFQGMTREVPEIKPRLENARALAVFGDSITTDHISPAGSIREDSPAGEYLKGHKVAPRDFNSYGSRRGNHEVMVRGTFANVRIRNRLVPEVEGGYTRRLPDGEVVSIYDAAVDYQREAVPLLILAGKEYGSGSSRDWAAKGPFLQGVRVVIAESFERIHRSNLIGMGILPLEFMPGDSIGSLNLTGEERFDLDLSPLCSSSGEAGGGGHEVKVCAIRQDGGQIHFSAQVRIDTPLEMEYYRHGGILHYVLRQLCHAGQTES
jgi:aconitate hydratase